MPTLPSLLYSLLYSFLPSRRYRRLAFFILLPFALETLHHIATSGPSRPHKNLDPPYAHACIPSDYSFAFPSSTGSSLPAGLLPRPDNGLPTPADVPEPRENATVLMLARNTEQHASASALRSLEEAWNQHYHYPLTLLNDAPWTPAFKAAITAVWSGPITFATIPSHMWSWPLDSTGRPHPPKNDAHTRWKALSAAGAPHARKESYHHMCRFYSGLFQDHEALTPYKYFWRVEPGVKFTCRIPYDPFRALRRRGQVYGYTVALWEVGATCPSLLRAVADYKERAGIAAGGLWAAMVEASWAPLPLRRWLLGAYPNAFPHRTREGDRWNHCHFWSNFEIADLDFFRSDAYRAFFDMLHVEGGFYTERWGDAPVHSLGVALLAKPEQVHFFEDIGYAHKPFQHCPPPGVGCECNCTAVNGEQVADTCGRKLRAGVEL